jgi:hypothetical protein
MNQLTAAEIGVFLGVTSSAVRQIVRRNHIAPTGKMGRAKVYDVREVLRHAGHHDRLMPRHGTEVVSH